MSARHRRWIFWAAGLLMVANVAAYFVYTLPRSLQKRNVASRVEELKVELGNERSRVAGLRTRAETIVANRKDSRVFLEQKVSRPGTALEPLLREVEALAEKQGLAVGSQSFKRDPLEGLPLEKFAITMPITGTYRQVTGLVGELERSSYFLTLDEISARQQGNAEGSIALNLLFSAYFRASTEVASR